MSYTQNMKNEKAPSKKVLIPEGWRLFTVNQVEYKTAKSGNPMFVFTVVDKVLQATDHIYAVAVEGKQWMLKSILAACGVQEDEAGGVTWDNPDVIGKEILCKVEHEPNEWINRQGETIKTTQSKITEISSDKVAWDDNA